MASEVTPETNVRSSRRRRWAYVALAGAATSVLSMAALPLPAAARVAPPDGGGGPPAASQPPSAFKGVPPGRRAHWDTPDECKEFADTYMALVKGSIVTCVPDPAGGYWAVIVDPPRQSPPPPPPPRQSPPRQACQPQPFPIPILPGGAAAGQKCG